MLQKLELVRGFVFGINQIHLRTITFNFWLFLLVLLYSCSFELDRTDPLPCTDTNECGCGELDIVDERDGQIYKTVWINEDGGNDPNKPGLCWMRDNLNVGKQVFKRKEVLNDNIIQKYCYNGDCDLYGGYYKYDEAIDYDPNISNVLSGQYFVKGICPDGWHLPSKEELGFLAVASNNNPSSLLRLRSNDTGFSGDTGGWVSETSSDTVSSMHDGDHAYYRSSTPSEGNRVFILQIILFEGNGIVKVVGDSTAGAGNLSSSEGLCIRCVKDY